MITLTPPGPGRHAAIRSRQRFSPIAAVAGVQATGVARTVAAQAVLSGDGQRGHRTDRPDLEAVLMGAVELARAAIIEFSGEDTVGEYLGASFEDPTAATHRFLADMPGYQGWQWAVVVAACPGADHATISEVVLVPGPTALLAPQVGAVAGARQARRPEPRRSAGARPPTTHGWCPATWRSGDPQVDEVAVEVGLGRRQVLSELGRSDAAQRWHDGDFGPGSAMARSTRRVCRDCGFYLPLAGALGHDVRGVRQRAGRRRARRRVRIRLRRTLRTPRSRPAPARRCTTRSTTACSDVTEPPAPSDEPQASSDDEQQRPSDVPQASSDQNSRR